MAKNRSEITNSDIDLKVLKNSKRRCPEDDYEKLFYSLKSKSRKSIKKCDFLATIHQQGITEDDPRLAEINNFLSKIPSPEISIDEFKELLNINFNLIEKSLKRAFVIANFSDFRNNIESIYKKTRNKEGGKVANYIPQLEKADPTKYGVSICSVDGQRCDFGDHLDYFATQSTCKPINYCLALEEHGAQKVHRYVGKEPSGTIFNALTLNNQGLPHNPMINAGAIMCSSLIKSELTADTRFEYVLQKWDELGLPNSAKFNNSVYLSEKKTADRNYALSYFMRENQGFPEGSDILDILDFYFQCCSIEINCKSLSVVAATLANGGVNPITNQQILCSSTVKHCLSLMSTCGMYDFSGEFFFNIGIPAKSGVSGAMLVVVPNVLGIALWSPKIDEFGNSVRGVEFCQELISLYKFHVFDSIQVQNTKNDPRKNNYDTKIEGVMAACLAASNGDVYELQRLIAKGINIDEADYDGRTALHLAAAGGHHEAVLYISNHAQNINPIDRWSMTPLDEAQKRAVQSVVELLKSLGARSGKN